MTTQDPKNLRSRFYLSEIARWVLVVFFLLALVLYFYRDLTLEAMQTIAVARDICLATGVVLLALGNFLRLSGSPMHRKLRFFWLILAIVFAIFWIFKGTTLVSNQLA